MSLKDKKLISLKEIEGPMSPHDGFVKKEMQRRKEALEYVGEDEYVEVTPKFIRLRKILLNEHDRKRDKKSVV